MAPNTVGQRHIIGQTVAAGYEIGARRTFSISAQRAWELITSSAGVRVWLGDVPQLLLEEGLPYETREGASGTIRVVEPGGHLRLTWQPPDWETASTIQVRVIPKGKNATIAFHQEHLAGGQEREEMYHRWQAVLDGLEALIEQG
jgi:uncharacterized protein YndB with AHSA1/START domain